MSGEFEAMADVATGALVASAINSPGAAQGAGGEKCLNCGTVLLGKHCHACGQAAHVHRTATALFHDIAHGVFHFEGRTWHTLPLLLWQPGELTRHYIHGERARFVSPMALFLFSVFLMVAVFGMVGGPIGTGGDGAKGVSDAAAMAQSRTELAGDLARVEKKIAELEAQKRAAETRGENVARLNEKLSDLRGEATGLRLVTKGTMNAEYKNKAIIIDDKDFRTGVPVVDRVVRHVAANPDLAAYKLQSSAYKFSWALIPISLPFIWLLFAFRRDVGMYDHAIFATYSLSAMTLMVVLLSFANALGMWSALIALTFLIFPPWHMYRQLKGAYRLSRWGAWWRMWMLVFSAYTSALIFFMFLVAVGAME
jgi:hypothetical protein